MRSSRISHPPGSRFVAVHVWAVHRFGLAGAAILGELDFLDRAQEEPNQPLASRARIIADLEGVVGRNAIDAALLNLEAAGAISRHVLTRPGERNIERRVSYGLNLDGLANLLGSPQTGSFRPSLNREFPEVPKSEPKSGLESGVPTYIGLEEKEAAALHAYSGSAAAPIIDQEKRKHPRRTANGIECWYPAEDAQADEIESKSDPEAVAAAVKAIKSRKNRAGKSTSPVPALVEEELIRLQRERDAQERLAMAEVRNRAKFSESALEDPNALAIGAQMIQKIRDKRQSENHPGTHQ